MKKKMLLIHSFVFLFFIPAFAQPGESKAYEKHQSVLTAGYGFGNLWKIFLEKGLAIPEYTVRSTGPFSLIYEYGVLNRFSIGMAASYSRVRGRSPRFQIADQITFLSLLQGQTTTFGQPKNLILTLEAVLAQVIQNIKI